MAIRNIYSDNVINNVKSTLNPISLTHPDDAISVKELFERYTTGTLQRDLIDLQRRTAFDGYDPSIDQSDPEDLVDLYEIAWANEREAKTLPTSEEQSDSTVGKVAAELSPSDFSTHLKDATASADANSTTTIPPVK